MSVNREKVISGLEWCLFKTGCNGCPYRNDCDDGTNMEKDALALLKAQEPVEYVVHCKNADFSNGTEFACGECGGSLLHKRVNYCPWCGKAVKWDD